MTTPKIDPKFSAELYTFAGKDLPWLMKKWADATPDKAFLIWEPKDGASKSWTYKEFWEEINKVACGLIAKGVKKGDKLLIHSENSPEMMIAWYASSIVGSCAVTTNTRCIGDELTYFAEHSEAVGCITQPKFIKELAANAKSIPWFVVTDDNSGEPAADLNLSKVDSFPPIMRKIMVMMAGLLCMAMVMKLLRVLPSRCCQSASSSLQVLHHVRKLLCIPMRMLCGAV